MSDRRPWSGKSAACPPDASANPPPRRVRLMSRRVLVTGGAGFIGSHVADAYLAAGWDVTVLDNLSRGQRKRLAAAVRFEALDAASPEARELVKSGRFEVITHL